MSRKLTRFLTWTLIASVCTTGCHSVQPFYLNEDGDLSHYLDAATSIDYADVDASGLEEASQTRAPRTVSHPHYDSIWDLSLEEAVAITLQNSKVVRSFGQVRQFGQILGGPPERLSAAPDSVASVYDPAILETGQGGVEQALANFDAAFNFSTTWDRRDRPQNFNAPTIFAQILQQDQVTINSELTKQAATGTQWFVRNITIYDDSTQTARALPSDYFTGLEAEFRQPLLRGRGTQVNRIPVVLARIRNDISLADFEFATRNLVQEVERAYWELYFFYRNLEAAKIGRDSALVTWQRINALFVEGAGGGEAQQLAQATEQYYFFRARVEEAQRDLYKSENRLRFLMGLTATDGRLIRPQDEPTPANVSFDWFSILDETLTRSVELRRQHWRIKQREMELIASRNQLLPQVDVVGIYRWLGIGDNFDSANRIGSNFPDVGSTAVDELLEGRYQEHQLGITASIPLGFRRELAQVRSQQLSLAREQAKLEDMELELTHQLTDAVQDLESQYVLAQTNLNRRVAAQAQVEALEAAYDVGTVTLDLLLDAQRRRADAEVAYYQALIEYNLAIMNVHFRKGSLLDYNGVVLAEGPWPAKAYYDAHQRARRRDASYYLDYGYSRPRVISKGPIPQNPNGAATGQSLGDGGRIPAVGDAETQVEPIPAGEPFQLDMDQPPLPMNDRAPEIMPGPFDEASPAEAAYNEPLAATVQFRSQPPEVGQYPVRNTASPAPRVQASASRSAPLRPSAPRTSHRHRSATVRHRSTGNHEAGPGSVQIQFK